MTAPQSPENNTALPRLFKVGTARILEDDSTRTLTTEQVRVLLKPLYPEVAHATIRETQQGDTLHVEFLPRPGVKG